MSQQLEDLFFNLRLPRGRGNQDISKYLEYEKAHLIDELTNITKKNVSSLFRDELYEKFKTIIPVIENQFDLILRMLDNYEINKDLSMQYLNKLINNIDNSFRKKYLIYPVNHCFKRVRNGDKFELTRSELFHLPFTEQGNYGRYSTPDIHTLYLTNDNLNVAWYECGLPSVFAYASFLPTCNLTIFRLNLCPYLHLFQKLKNTYLNPNKSKTDLDEVEQDICNYLTFYPLLISCSLSVLKRDTEPQKEYFISNLLIDWIQKSESIDGISYFPCSFYSIGREQGVNYAFPTKTNTKKYCEILSDKFLLSNPKLMRTQLDVTHDISICTEVLNQLTCYQRLSSKLENFLMYCYTLRQSLQLIEKNNNIQLDYLQSVFRSLRAIFEDYDLLSECISNELTEKIISDKLPCNCDHIMSVYQTYSNKIKTLLKAYDFLFDYFQHESNSDDSFERIENKDLAPRY